MTLSGCGPMASKHCRWMCRTQTVFIQHSRHCSHTDGCLYGLVNNAAYRQTGAIEDLSTDLLRVQFETNFFGWHELTRRIIPVMRSAGEGRIVQISSILGVVSLPLRGVYNASKDALESYSDTLRMELAGTEVQVCLVLPGPIRSQFRANARRVFHESIDVEHSHFSRVYKRILKALDRNRGEVMFSLPPRAVAEKVHHALHSPRARARYVVTMPAYGLAMLKRILPDRLMDWVLGRAAGEEYRRIGLNE